MGGRPALFGLINVQLERDWLLRGYGVLLSLV